MTEIAIRGVYLWRLHLHEDERGSLMELFRSDILPLGFAMPAMGYASTTMPGKTRGPHEHNLQTDLFAFPGPGVFRVKLWDNRAASQTHGVTLELKLGGNSPALLAVPPGVVHGYRNISQLPGLVLNFPDRLYRGKDRQEIVDEIRHEAGGDSRFLMEELL